MGLSLRFDPGRSTAAAYWVTVCLFFIIGGTSRDEAIGNALIAPFAVLIIGFATYLGAWGAVRTVRPVAIFLFAAAATMALQLFPLPPSIWSALPGRESYAEMIAIAGMGDRWMSWSLSPARTILSLLMVLPCLAVVITYGGVARLGSHVRLLPLCVIVLAGGMLGLFQLLGPARGPFYLYAITNPESSVGFFANRNHHAVALAASIPMWGAYLASREKPKVGVRDNVAILVWLAIGVTFIFALACESRAGAALALVGVASLPFVLMERAAMGKALRMLWQRPWLIGCVVALVVVGIALAAWSNLQVTAIQRIGQGNSIEELRVKLVPVLWDMASDFFPAGSGAGTFEAVYRHFEPAALLSPQYLNKAHNDLAQVIIEFGLLGVIAVLFLLWLPLSALTKLVRANELTRAGRAEVVGASVAFLSLLAGSLVDYPLRTPAGAVLLTVLGCVIVSAGASRRPR